MQFFAVGLMVLSALSLFGWGTIFRRLVRSKRGIWAVTPILGLAVVVFLGGVLNLIGQAYSWSLALIILVGLFPPAASAWKSIVERGGAGALRDAIERLRQVPWYLAVLFVGLIGFTIATQLPPSAYNYADDFQKYFVFPVRMLQTGTVLGGMLDGLGAETLGGQAFLHGFAISILPISYINAVDAVFGFALCLLLAPALCGGNRMAVPAALGLLSVAFIDPIYVNISTLYLGSASIMAAVAVSAHKQELGAAPNGIALGALYAAMVAMKTTFLLFAVLHAVLAAVVLIVHNKAIGKALRFVAVTIASGIVFLSPWLLLNLPHYLSAHAIVQPDLGPPAERPLDILDMFSYHFLIYGDGGDSTLQFTLIMSALIAGAATATWLTRKLDAPLRLSAFMVMAAVLSGLASYVILLTVFGPRLAGYGQSLRYFAPFAIGLVPSLSGIVAGLMAEAWAHRSRALNLLVPAGLAAVPILTFSPSFAFRAEQAEEYHGILAFDLSRRAEYLDYNNYVLRGGMRFRVKDLQSLVPPGEPLTVWINAPFLIDFRRNPIGTVDIAGLATPWAHMPESGYVIFEYGGYATPSLPAEGEEVKIVGAQDRFAFWRGSRFGKTLAASISGDNAIYNDGDAVVFKVPPGGLKGSL